MLTLFSAVASLAAAAPDAVVAADPCAGQQNCRQASAAQLFDLADKLFAQGDLAGAEEILIALTQDPHPELRAEARFRLAAVREKRGNLDGAVAALRELLAEQPDANPARLELSRILAEQGHSGAAQHELERAQAAGLPADVARTVGRFASLLSATKRRGASIEISAGPDSNVNRSTGSSLIDTVIAPFELSPDARRQAGVGVSIGAQAYSRDPIGKGSLLTRVGAHADLYPGKGRFNDIQLYGGTGPEFDTGIGRIRPALTLEQRWYGQKAYSSGVGGALSLTKVLSPKSQIELDGSVVHQAIHHNAFLDGTRYAGSATWDRLLSERTTLRLNLRGAILDARSRPESLRQGSVEAILARDLGWGNAFGDIAYTKTHGLEDIALFGKTRNDDRVDLGAGFVARRRWNGFTPLARLSYTRSWSNIALYDYSRVRLDLGLSRDF
jgi:tetratricopeptide (TPR) repeat protein